MQTSLTYSGFVDWIRCAYAIFGTVFITKAFLNNKYSNQNPNTGLSPVEVARRNDAKEAVRLLEAAAAGLLFSAELESDHLLQWQRSSKISQRC